MGTIERQQRNGEDDMIKLTTTQQSVMDKILATGKTEMNINTETRQPPAGSKQWVDSLEFRANPQTLKALEKKGLIEILYYVKSVGATIKVKAAQ